MTKVSRLALRTAKRAPRTALVLLLVTAFSPLAAAQQIPAVPQLASAIDIDRVRALYGAAAYEEALAAMPAVNGESVGTDLEQYRALCLLALGREKEAVATVERLVRDNPMYVPSASDTSPRMQSIFTGARSKLVPQIAKQAYAEAKGAYEAKNRDAAHAAFKRTIELIESLPDAEKTLLADLRLLAGEFLTLSAPPPAPRAAASACSDQHRVKSLGETRGGRSWARSRCGSSCRPGSRRTAQRRGRSTSVCCGFRSPRTAG